LCDHIHRACLCGCRRLSFSFFNDTVPTEIYTLSLHDALPIWFTGRLASAFSARRGLLTEQGRLLAGAGGAVEEVGRLPGVVQTRSEEHTSELQSLTNLVCRLLLEKKKDP